MANLINRLKLKVKKLRNKPDSFYFLEKDNNDDHIYEGKVVKTIPLGKEREVTHLTLHDMMPHAVSCAMTDIKYLENIQANAVHVLNDKFKKIDKYNRITFFQPLQVDIMTK